MKRRTKPPVVLFSVCLVLLAGRLAFPEGSATGTPREWLTTAELTDFEATSSYDETTKRISASVQLLTVMISSRNDRVPIRFQSRGIFFDHTTS